jgi:WD40 repeat protein
MGRRRACGVDRGLAHARSARVQANLTVTGRLATRHVMEDCGTEVFSVAISPDSQFVAAGLGNSNVAIFSVATGRLVFTLRAKVWASLSLWR